MLLSIALVFSMFGSLAYAADEMTAQEKFDALKEKGIFKGINEAGDAGLDQPMNRAQFARVAALILGLEGIGDPDTLEVTEQPFSDVALNHWAVEEITAAKAAGLFVGNGDGTFTPDVNITVQQLAVVVAGLLGLDAVEDATVEGAADWAAPYIQAIVNAGVTFPTNYTEDAIRSDLVDAAFTADAVINPPVEVVELQLDSAEAITNGKVKVTLKEAVTAVDASAFSIKDADGTALEVSAAALSSDGKSVTLTTAAQTTGKLYTLTANGVDVTFVGAVKDETKPTLTMAVAKSNTVVEVTFSEAVDEASALNAANYTIDNSLTVNSVVAGDDSTKVLLNTSAQTSGTLYTVTVKNVADLSGNVIADSSKKFGGVAADATKPTINTVVSKDGIKLEVTFTETGMLDASSALNVANYTVSGLTITAAEFKSDTNKLGVNPVVILTTSAQTSGTLYTLKVSNVADITGNIITADSSKTFGGTPLDTTKLSLSTAVALTNTSVELTFNDNVDKATGEDVANYTIAGLTISKAEVSDAKVTLTTSAQTGGTLYTVAVANLLDDAGNALDVKEKKFGGIAPDTTKPGITSATGVDKNTVDVKFNEKVTKAVANNPANYSISDLGYATKAVLQGDGVTVRLTTASQSTGKIYTITVNNVTDLSGNVIATDSKTTFGGIGDALSKLQVVGATMLDKSTVKVFLNQAVSAASGAETEANFEINEVGNAAPAAGSIAGAAASNISTKNTGGGPVAKVVGTNSDEILITFSSSYAAESGKVYKITLTGITGKYGAAIDTDKDDAEFAGTASAKADLKIDAAQAIDKRTVEFTYSADLDTTIDATKFTLYTNEGLSTGAIAGSSAATSGNKAIVVFASDLADNTVYYLNVADAHNVKDVSGLYNAKNDNAASAAEAVFATATLAAPALEVTGAVMVDESTLDIYFNRDLDVQGAFDATASVVIKDSTAANVVSAGEFKTVETVDGKKLRVYFVDAATKISAGGVYTVEVAASADIRIKNNTGVNLSAQTDAAKRKADFAGITTAKAEPSIASVVSVSNTKILVTMSESLSAALDVTANSGQEIEIYNGSSKIDPAKLSISADAPNKVFEITLTGGVFAAGTTYTVVIDNDTTVKDFSGIKNVKVQATDTGTENSATFSGAALTAATSTITSAVYDESDDTITITGTNFLTAGAAASDIKAQLDWTKIVFDINGDDATTANQTYVLADITSAVVTSDTVLTITLAGAKATALEGLAGYDAGGVLSGAADTLDVTAGFIKDAALNAATTDGKANAAVTVQP